MSVKQYDDLDQAVLMHIANCVVQAYPQLNAAQIRLLCRSENATFLVTAQGKRYALRLHRGNYHDKAAIESELLWLDALREEGLQVPEALFDGTGKRIQTYVLSANEQRHAVIFHWIAGEMPTSEVSVSAFRQLGEITARLHQHSRQWQRPEGFQRLAWDHASMVSASSHWGDWRDITDMSSNDHQLLESVLDDVQAKLTRYGKRGERFGLIHADLRLTNLLIEHGETRVIDFDDCGFGWYLHDLAAAISFVEHHANAPLWVENWIEGYQKICTLSDEDFAILPALFIQRRVQLTAWLASHHETEMAKSVANGWSSQTVALCRTYLDGKHLPIGGGMHY
ncbi:phosphotransferase [Rosenbergiella australiborealis]|uniref:Phosphotransferase n=1 Tax=Rosenbergiella australiborealis TaxID=1544696 RepID=A0ABS5T3Y1_9GAMM|nr:phosphotransferase [Rosenbergiella australiborealis]MBT0726165.1 phosphotransferase [Rosenbergiella australiborealis]